MTGWFWTLDLPCLASSSSSKCAGQRRRSNRDGAEVTNGGNEEVINVTGEEGTEVEKKTFKQRKHNAGGINCKLIGPCAHSCCCICCALVEEEVDESGLS